MAVPDRHRVDLEKEKFREIGTADDVAVEVTGGTESADP